MRYAISVPPGGTPSDLVAAGVAAEGAGWDGFFLWDHVYVADGWPLHDPWVLLGAIATRTTRIRLGAMVTPPARRRPWKLAKELTTLDHLSEGRVVVGLGLGLPDAEFTAFGEPADPRTRAALLDESLTVLDAFLRGDEVHHEGHHFQIHARLTPAAHQTPRPPIWLAATWPHRRPLSRAARYDGVYALGPSATGTLTPAQVATIRTAVGPAPDIVIPHDPSIPEPTYEKAGATWQIVGPPEPSPDWLHRLRATIDAGPPPFAPTH